MPRARAFGRQSRVVARACVRAPEPLAASAALAPEAPGEEDACVRPAASPRRQASRCRLNPPSRRCRRGRGPTRTSATAAARLASGHKPARPRAALPRSLTPGLGGGSSSASRSSSHRAGMAGTRPWLRAPPAGSGDGVDRGLGGGAATTARHQRWNRGHGADWATATPPFPAL